MSPSMEVISSLSTQKKFSSPSQSHVTYFPASDLRGIFDHLHRLKKTEHLHVEFDNMDTVQILDSTGTFLIAGGFGGLGRAIARWMVSRGARSLILLSRSGPKNNPNALVLLDELRARQIKFQNPRCDATNREKLLQKIARQQALAYE
ncbi:Highly reducing polyketide synthase sor1 [Metarhizium anisopliae]|nr:Highly reducing polyketide synthase sor1 [Metarhizium anisopliae]